MASIREEAEHFRVALAMGLLDRGEVVAWADRIIMDLDNPPGKIIEVSLAGARPADELERLLADIPGPADVALAAHAVLGILRERLEAGAVTLASAVDMLWTYHQVAAIPESEKLQASVISYLLDSAIDGYYGTIEGVREEVLRFLNQHPPASARP